MFFYNEVRVDGSNSDFMGVPTFGADFDFLTPNSRYFISIFYHQNATLVPSLEPFLVWEYYY
ncbi:hypothetical protein BWD12_17905 [Leptospira santarosai serovar Bananal]|nr:hypothetical protein BWD11_11580 [Leptospira santarosai serovar Grippotyphosa]ONF76578.1 hypothetical protein BWD12_17905 [Leptospira santarosai serovar Bananal]ONF85015.1 hypothetical protein BWD13_14460 [Leptospira santarosai serovar Grippotyphosa]ONF88211.1 hypothetical protein BWD13_03120 [Leptospira santarosai serovar Grippotyphosa]